eukprot:Gb_15138 [translate_table: standard]
MGCTNSKGSQRRAGAAGDEGAGNRPLPRCFSMPIPNSCEQEKENNKFHLVSLTSTTYGNLDTNMNEEADYLPRKEEYPHGFYGNYRRNFDRSSQVAAKTWSEVNNLLSDYKPYKEFAENKNNVQEQEQEQEQEEEEEEEAETINTWELMDGLDDDSNTDQNEQKRKSLDASFSFNTVKETQQKEISLVNPDENNEENGRKPLWMHFADDSSNALFDPEVVSVFRKALDQLSPTKEGSAVSFSGTLNSFNTRDDIETPASTCSRSSRFRSNSFHRPLNKSPAKLTVFDEPRKPDSENQGFEKLRAPPGGEDRVVLYFTSLRAIRKTYEDCCNVRLILQGFRIFVDERDVSLHAEYREELQKLLGKQQITVPVLFVRGECIGGADEVMQLHEEGELDKYLEGFPVQSCIRVCDGCGDLRFVPCLTCNGSCKLYTDEDELIRCPDCNENGLISPCLCNVQNVVSMFSLHCFKIEASEPDENMTLLIFLSKRASLFASRRRESLKNSISGLICCFFLALEEDWLLPFMWKSQEWDHGQGPNKVIGEGYGVISISSRGSSSLELGLRKRV